MHIHRGAGRLTWLAALPHTALAQDYAVLATNLFGGGVPGSGAGEEATGDFDGEIDFKNGSLWL